MGSIFGGITDAIGLTDHAGERKAANAANANAAAANAMSAEQIQLAKDQLNFTKEQYTDWKNIYGDVQTNLGEYYKNLTPDKITALGLENQQREYQQVEASIKRDFAQRGLTNSGQETTASTIAKVQNATARAKIRSSADQDVVNEQLKFLGVGLGQGTELLGVVGNAANNVTNAFATGINSRTNIANSYLGRANALGTANIDAMGQVVGSAIGAYGAINAPGYLPKR